MQIVINIPEEVYKASQIIDAKYENVIQIPLEVIKNGTPLPKGHGKLVDATALPQEDKNIVVKSILAPGTIACVGAIRLQEYVNGLPTIIEADKGESEG